MKAETPPSPARLPLLGHEPQRDFLMQLQSRNRLAQAFCFVGPDGIGKELTAKTFISWEMCRQPIASFQPCGRCEACTKMAHGNHPDFIAVAPEKNVIKIEVIREVIRQAQFRPLVHGRRWILISQADQMTEQAQNALLRTLEEPPRDSHFILLTCAKEKLLQTIRSRCLMLRFASLSKAHVAAILQALEPDIPKEQFPALLSLAHGSPGRAIQAARGEISHLRKEVLEQLILLLETDRDSEKAWRTLAFAQHLGGHKTERSLMVHMMQNYLRDLAFHLMGAPTEDLANPDYFESIQSLCQRPSLTVEKVLTWYRHLAEADRAFDVNTHAELTFFHTLREFQ